MRGQALLVMHVASVSSTSLRPGFFWWVLALMNNVLDMVDIRPNLEIKGDLIFIYVSTTTQ